MKHYRWEGYCSTHDARLTAVDTTEKRVWAWKAVFVALHAACYTEETRVEAIE